MIKYTSILAIVFSVIQCRSNNANENIEIYNGTTVLTYATADTIWMAAE